MIVCVHGLGVSPRHFRPLARTLGRAGFAVLVPELPMGVPVEEHARRLADAMTRAGIERAPLVGNSMGCQTAVELAATRPERVAALVLVGPTTDPAAATMPRLAVRLAIDTFRETPVHDWVVGTDYLRRGPLKTYRQARFMVRHRVEERLPLAGCPVLVVRGERDAIAPRRWVEEAAALAPRGEWAEVPGAAHSAHYTHPDRCSGSRGPT